jgi:hypothetical protein
MLLNAGLKAGTTRAHFRVFQQPVKSARDDKNKGLSTAQLKLCPFKQVRNRQSCEAAEVAENIISGAKARSTTHRNYVCLKAYSTRDYTPDEKLL